MYVPSTSQLFQLSQSVVRACIFSSTLLYARLDLGLIHDSVFCAVAFHLFNIHASSSSFAPGCFRARNGAACKSHHFWRRLSWTLGQTALQTVQPERELRTPDLRNRTQGGRTICSLCILKQAFFFITEGLCCIQNGKCKLCLDNHISVQL